MVTKGCVLLLLMETKWPQHINKILNYMVEVVNIFLKLIISLGTVMQKISTAIIVTSSNALLDIDLGYHKIIFVVH